MRKASLPFSFRAERGTGIALLQVEVGNPRQRAECWAGVIVGAVRRAVRYD